MASSLLINHSDSLSRFNTDNHLNNNHIHQHLNHSAKPKSSSNESINNNHSTNSIPVNNINSNMINASSINHSNGKKKLSRTTILDGSVQTNTSSINTNSGINHFDRDEFFDNQYSKNTYGAASGFNRSFDESGLHSNSSSLSNNHSTNNDISSSSITSSASTSVLSRPSEFLKSPGSRRNAAGLNYNNISSFDSNPLSNQKATFFVPNTINTNNNQISSQQLTITPKSSVEFSSSFSCKIPSNSSSTVTTPLNNSYKDPIIPGLF